MEFTITWRELLVAVALATAFYLLEYAVFSRRREAPPAPGEKSVESEGIAMLRAEIGELRRRLEVLENAQRRPAPIDTAAGGDNYDAAMRYASQGMPAGEIAALCGISRDEAALIVALQRKGRNSP